MQLQLQLYLRYESDELILHIQYIIFLQKCTIQILINGKSREDVRSGQRSRGFRVGRCQIMNMKIIDFVTRAKLKADLRSDNTGRAIHHRNILHL